LGPTSETPEVASKAASVPGDAIWRFFCECLAQEHQVYVPKGNGPGGLEVPRGVVASWHELFEELYPLHRGRGHKSEPSAEHDEDSSFKIAVAARFRPADSITNGRAVVLPLHQQVQLVREKLKCGKQEAVRMIMHEQQELKGIEVAKEEALNSNGEIIFQACVAPTDQKDKENLPGAAVNGREVLIKGEKALPENSCSSQACSGVLAVRQESATVLALTKQSGLRDFAFDRVFGESSRQEDVYDLSAKRLVMEFLNGQSASLISYGQTGSGKTFTMFSPPATRGPLGISVAPARGLRGVVPRACEDILETVRLWREQGFSADIGVSYVEVFGSEVSDLLHEGQVVGQGQEGRYDAVRATDRVGHRYVLDGHTEKHVESWEEVAELLRLGDEAKRRAATAMNERSTRAHTLFVLTLKTGTSQSRFYFADLGGSEQINKSKADADTKAPVTVIGGVEASRISWREYYDHRQRIQETLNINKGLFALKRVIEALHNRSRLSREGVSPHLLPYVPYQDSKLTMILQEALGGCARTMVLATATMDPAHADESLQTLRFAEMCSQVQKRQEESQAASVRESLGQIEKEITQVEADIVAKERWETRLVRRSDVDTIGGAFGEGETWVRQEVIPTSVLVGAEAERERLEMLLNKRQELEGLTGGFGRDYREMKAGEAKDGGKGTDFREKERFSTKMKAHDFENEIVLADALRFMFRKAKTASTAFGETESTTTRRLPRMEIPFGYFRVARALKGRWEDALASGLESRSFGKAMMDRCQEWAQLKSDPSYREESLQALMKECEYMPAACDALPFSEVPEESGANTGLSLPASGSSGTADIPDEF
jgi:kinesin family protein 5